MMTEIVTQMISTNYFILVASPPWELRALVLKRRYSHMTALDEGRRGLAGGSRRSRNRRGGCVELVAVSADQRGRRTSWRGGGLPKLGGMEEPPRCPLTLSFQDGGKWDGRVHVAPQSINEKTGQIKKFERKN